jgi:hypothetical protein
MPSISKTKGSSHFPVVIREHSIETEISIYRRDAALRRKAIIRPGVPPTTLDTTIDITNLAVARILLQAYQDPMTQKIPGNLRQMNVEVPIRLHVQTPTNSEHSMSSW